MFSFNKLSFKAIITLFTDHLYLVLLIPLIFIIYPLLGPGVVMFGDFPLQETSLYSQKFLSTWIDYGSHHGFETLSRYPIITLGAILSSLNISPDVISKFLVVLGFFTASFSFYFSFILFFRDKLSNHVTLYRIAAVIGSLFYAYNVWSFHRIHHWYLWFGYATLPLFIISLIYAFKNPTKWWYVFATVMIWSLASSTPHMVIFYALFYIGISIYFIFSNIRNKQALPKLGITITSIILLYLLVNLYWMYPYYLYSLSSGQGSLLPSILVTEELTMILSRDSIFLNVIRLIQDWWQPRIIDVNPDQTSFLYPFWLFASFVPPIVAFSALLLRKNRKYVLLFTAMGIVGIVLTLGTNGPYNFYSILLFEAPLLPSLQYSFRDPDKWAFMIALAYSFLLSMITFEILRKVKGLKHSNILAGSFLALILGSFLLYSYPTYSSTAQKVLDPIVIPTEYGKLNRYLKNIDTERIFFIFQDYAPTVWNKQREFYGFDQRVSDKPNTMAYQYLPVSENYHEYIADAILSNKSNKINNLIFPLGTSYIIYSNDEVNKNVTKLKELSLSRDFTHIKDIGFIKIFKADKNTNVRELHIPKQQIVLVGGLDLFSLFNSLPSFNSINSSLIFLDQNLNRNQKYQSVNSADYVALARNFDDLILSLLDEKYIINTFDLTNHGDPSKVWSKDSAMDIIHGEFHAFLKNLGIENWDFDYGRGLVMTDASGANLSVPVQIENQNNNNTLQGNGVDLFVRYLKNQKGGQMKIYLDNKLINQVDTFDKIANRFVWEKIGSVNLTKGKHTLTLENTAGLNAVNVFAIIPTDQLNGLRSDIGHLLAGKTRVMYPMEAESSFYNAKGRDIGSFQNLLTHDSGAILSNNSGIFTRTISGQFKAPDNSDLAALQFLAKKIPNATSSFSIKDLEVMPAFKKYNGFTSDFESQKYTITAPRFDVQEVSIPLENLSQFGWVNNHKDILSTSLESNRSINGNNSLKVDIEKGNFSYWGTVSSDFIPINENENASYSVSLALSAKDVKQLHSKVFYYDSNKKEISWDYIFGGRDGTFRDNFNNIITPPNATKYIKLQLWVSPNPKVNSSYLLDNVKLKELSQFGWVNNHKDILSTSLESNRSINGNNSLKVDIEKGNFSYWGTVSSDFIPINENENKNASYSVSLALSAKDVNQLHSKIYYFDAEKKEIQGESIFSVGNGTFKDNFNNIITPPNAAKYIKLQLWVSSNPKVNSSYLLDNVKLKELSQFGWVNNQKDILSTSLESNRSINGNNSLKVDIEKGNFSYSGTISSDLIPINDNAFYDYSLDVSAKDVNQLHSKVYYFDAEKKELKEEVGFDGRNGSFEQKFKKAISPPLGAKYINLQLWVSPNPKVNSSYLLDNVKLEEIIPTTVSFKGSANLEDPNLLRRTVIPKDNKDNTVTNYAYDKDNDFMLGKGNSTFSNIVQTKPFPVKQDQIYNYSMTLQTKNMSSIYGIVSFKSSRDVIQNSNLYSDNASNGHVLSLGPSSEIRTNVDIVKASNYTVAVRSKTCETCTYLRVSMERLGEDSNFSKSIQTSNITLKSNTSGLKWLSSNNTFPLEQGTYEIGIYSDSSTDLDAVLVYQIDDEKSSSNANNKNDSESLSNPFSKDKPPAIIAEYKKINPTKYEVEIRNATRPHMISFAESYDPQWIARTISDDNENSNENNNFKTNSIPLYSIINGFYINKTGSFKLIIEYQPQEWFLHGGALSLGVLLAILVIFIIGVKRFRLQKIRKFRL
jgi:hypothetical protein